MKKFNNILYKIIIILKIYQNFIRENNLIINKKLKINALKIILLRNSYKSTKILYLLKNY